MRNRRIRALALATAVLSGVLVGGLSAGTAAAAPAATPLDSTKTGAAELHDLRSAVRVAQEHAKQGTKSHARKAAAAAAADPCASEHPNTGSTVVARRFSGADRYATAVCVSKIAWEDKTDTEPADQDWVADAVVLARGDLFPDALAAGPLAAQVEGPLLLTKPTTLLSNVKAEIQRVLAPKGKVYLIGGTGSLSTGVENTIKAMGYTPVRISGADRFATAINIAKAIPATPRFFVTTGMNFPDALTAGNAAATITSASRYDESGTILPAVLVFSKDSTLPKATGDFIVDRVNQFDSYALITAGGAANTATAKAFGSDAITGHYVGKDRYATATLIAEDMYPDLETGKLVSPFVGLVDGLNFPDALAGTVPMAHTGSPLLLTAPKSLSATTAQFLRNHAGDVTPTMYADVFGGTGAVSDSVMIAARTALTPTA